MQERYRVYEGHYPHFITNTVHYWIPLFCRDDYFQVLVDSLRYCTEQKGLVLHGYVLMPNHFHALSSQTDGRLPDVVRDLKRHTSTVIAAKLEEDCRITWLRALRNAGGGEKVSVWIAQYHPIQVHSLEFLQQKLEYMHQNPVRAGFVERAEDWKYSSAGFYLRDWEPQVPVVPLEW